jgi:uncharacterized protein (DUF488 family)
MIDIYTIGFTQKSAEVFFNLIKKSNIKTLVDVRLNNVSQLAGFAKRDDLKFFLKELCSVDYIHRPELAPTEDILKAYKKKEIPWDVFEKRFIDILIQRCIEKHLNIRELENACLLCSEHEPKFCHRRLIVEYLSKNSEYEINIKHLC